MESNIKVKQIIAFTDGSSYNDTKNKMRHGGIGVYFPDYKNLNISRTIKVSNPTNQKTELLGCIYAVKKIKKILKEHDYKFTVKIYTDSKYVHDAMNSWCSKWEKNNWQRKKGKQNKSVSNLEYMKKLFRYKNKYNIEFEHVRAHKKEPEKTSKEWYYWNGNDQADQLAKNGMLKSKNKFRY